ncbi:hypothetical protein CPJ18_02050 [Agrobacterium rosae]|uniref:Endonuclease GajA/Old nuclease/RecF-like AAA domain-containing protein n=1 Tax=Agrobacterium rosae TaxID=1972867 RepID=A0AAE5S1T5_9HYPH|nr:AAA family ATPase [Agrobacterium rosae]POO54306.1 hypothetical protein CPJ18_02050 [Agrobacterium rosae]
MSTKFYFQSVKVENFRSFREITIPKFKRINIFGGFNGVGKTAMLEILFFLLDRRNPASLIKPLMFRRFATSSPIDPLQFLHEEKLPHACVEWNTPHSRLRMDMAYELKPDDISVPVESNSLGLGLAGQFGTDSIFSTQKGLHISVTADGGTTPIERFFTMAAPAGLTGIMKQTDNSEVPLGEYVSTSTRADAKQLAQMISTLVKSKRLREVVGYMRLLHSDLETFMTLQDGEEVQVYAQMLDGKMLPVQYMGDGFQNLLHTLCAIVRCANGVVFLDEIDAAIHYSVVTEAWKIISRAAADENCQIFATTHSRECIHSAALGVKQAGRSKDFQYIRLEKSSERHAVVHYDIDELSSAENYDIEIR